MSGVIRFQFDCPGVVCDCVGLVAGVEIGRKAGIVRAYRAGLRTDGFVVVYDGGVLPSGEYMVIAAPKRGDAVRVSKVLRYLVIYDNYLSVGRAH